MTLALLVSLLTQINILAPTAIGLADVILDWFKRTHPTVPNSEIIAALRQHGLANIANIDAWFAAHPDA
jgi:hypothetical protein